MAEFNGEAEKRNGGVYVEVDGNSGAKQSHHQEAAEVTLYGVFSHLISQIFFPTSESSYASATVGRRIKASVSENVPLLRDASRNTGRRILLWTRRGSPFRALLVVSVGTITLLTLTGLLVFTLFFLAATINAIVISLLISLAVAGGFLVLFFAGVTVIYIGALSVAAFVISTATISAIIAAIIASGWIGFFFAVWVTTKKSVGVAKSMTGSAVSAYSSARRARSYHETNKISD